MAVFRDRDDIVNLTRCLVAEPSSLGDEHSVAENIHAPNDGVCLDSVMHTARTYAMFAARRCGLTG